MLPRIAYIKIIRAAFDDIDLPCAKNLVDYLVERITESTEEEILIKIMKAAKLFSNGKLVIVDRTPHIYRIENLTIIEEGTLSDKEKEILQSARRIFPTNRPYVFNVEYLAELDVEKL